MLQNAYFLAKIGADTAENEQHFFLKPRDGLRGNRRKDQTPTGDAWPFMKTFIKMAARNAEIVYKPFYEGKGRHKGFYKGKWPRAARKRFKGFL